MVRLTNTNHSIKISKQFNWMETQPIVGYSHWRCGVVERLWSAKEREERREGDVMDFDEKGFSICFHIGSRTNGRGKERTFVTLILIVCRLPSQIWLWDDRWWTGTRDRAKGRGWARWVATLNRTHLRGMQNVFIRTHAFFSSVRKMMMLDLQCNTEGEERWLP